VIYTYRCPEGHEQIQVHGMGEDPEILCETCSGLCKRVIRPASMKVRHVLKGDCRDYREDLARFPNDPEAFVDGPRALKKLLDKRKREGAFVRDLSDAAKAPDQSEDEDPEFLTNAYQQAIDAINDGEEN
jgi:predicted nucleic acid-binding Zn ribbon protein